MRLHAQLTQALPPGTEDLRIAQLPGIGVDEISSQPPNARKLEDIVDMLEKNKDKRMSEVKKAMKTWGSIELVDASFKGVSSLDPSSCAR